VAAVSVASESLDFSKLRQDLVRAVSRVCPAWLADRRDDLVQAAVMRVMQVFEARRSTPEGNTPLAASYLYKVAYSALVDEIRRVRRRRETDLEQPAVAAAAVARDDPERTAISREIGRGIQECLQRMKRERRLAVTLHLQGHSVSDAARICDWSSKQTENFTYRGLTDLRKCLTSKGIAP
jgi:RNA polymerase sigma-70 factor (ECF subfamily)